MNHEPLRQTLLANFLLVYNDLKLVYDNEATARQELGKLARSALEELNLGDGLASTAKALLLLYKKNPDEALYFKLKTLNSAIKIIEEYNRGL